MRDFPHYCGMVDTYALSSSDDGRNKLKNIYVSYSTLGGATYFNAVRSSIRPGVNPPSTIPNPNPIPVDFLIPNPNPIPVNLAMIPNPIPIPVIFPSAIPNPNPIQISSY